VDSVCDLISCSIIGYIERFNGEARSNTPDLTPELPVSRETMLIHLDLLAALHAPRQ
jgi:hypothetical protein